MLYFSSHKKPDNKSRVLFNNSSVSAAVMVTYRLIPLTWTTKSAIYILLGLFVIGVVLHLQHPINAMAAVKDGKVDDAHYNTVGEDIDVINLSLDLDQVKQGDLGDSNSKIINDKWIVVTSISKAPTDDLKKLSKIKGWKMVVVGDKKSPALWDLPGVVFLSIDAQESIGFETVEFLEYNCYQRKSVGYLYAIQHGAKFIYDTDDDNHPYNGIINFDDSNNDKQYLVFHAEPTQDYYNPMPHFGQSTLWPRGYPLNKISMPPVRTYKKCRNARPLVQQGVVDGDPDLDAIQRLTRKDNNVKFDVTFDHDAPPVILPDNSLTPYNTQNTILHYEAFFSLVLPQTVDGRVCDIWRSYFTQRLLWDIGGHLEYHTATAYQDRTPHDLLIDFIQEDDLYKKALSLTQFLLQWKGTKITVEERFFEMIKALYENKFVEALDVLLARAWIRDLKRVGYNFPTIQKSKMVCEEKVVEFHPVEQGSMYLGMGEKTLNILDLKPKIEEQVHHEPETEVQ